MSGYGSDQSVEWKKRQRIGYRMKGKESGTTSNSMEGRILKYFRSDMEKDSFIIKSMSISQKANFIGEQYQNFYTQNVTSVACSIHFTGSMS